MGIMPTRKHIARKHVVIEPPPPEAPRDSDDARIIERPNGFYWQSASGTEYGPFATLLAARQDMELADEEEALEPGETLQEAEAEIGISDWIDPDTGEPAELDGAYLEEH